MTFPILQRLAGPGLVVTDDQALQAVALAFAHLRIVLEPGGAVALAAALFAPDLPETVIAVGTGGNVDPAIFATALGPVRLMLVFLPDLRLNADLTAPPPPRRWC